MKRIHYIFIVVMSLVVGFGAGSCGDDNPASADNSIPDTKITPVTDWHWEDQTGVREAIINGKDCIIVWKGGVSCDWSKDKEEPQ